MASPMALAAGREEAAAVPFSSRPSFSGAGARSPGPGLGPGSPPGPPQPLPQPLPSPPASVRAPSRACPEEAPPLGGRSSELLGLCGSHLQLLGQLLASEDEVPHEAASSALARSSSALARTLARAAGADEASSLSPKSPLMPWAPRPRAAHRGDPLTSAELAKAAHLGDPLTSAELAKAAPLCNSKASSKVSAPLSPLSPEARVPTTGSPSVPLDAEVEEARDIQEALASLDSLSAYDMQMSGMLAKRVRYAMNSAWLETFWLSCIVISTVFVAIEEQYRGSRLGNRLGEYDEMGSRRDEALEATLLALEITFAIVFTIEVILRLIAMRSTFWSDWKCILDLIVVVATDIAMVLDQVVRISFNIQVVRLLRLTRVLRVIRLTRNIAHFESATVMAAALRSCVGSANCAILIFFTGLTLLALLMARIVRNAYLGEDSPLDARQKFQLWLYFGTYTRSMMSMFELALANWPEIGRFLQDEVHEGWMVFVILYKLTVGFAVVGILNAVFMQETFTAIEMDNNIMVEKKRRADKAHRKKMEALFKRADRNGDGCVGRHEFAFILRSPLIRMWLSSMNLDVSDGKLLFELIDSEHPDGKITSDELINGVARLRGPARSIDVKALRMWLEGGGKTWRRELSQAEDIPVPKL